MFKDLHDSITDFWANTVSRDHGDGLRLGIARRRHVCNLASGLHVTGIPSASQREAFLALANCSGELLLTAFLCSSAPRNPIDSIMVYKTLANGSRFSQKPHLLGLQQRPRKP